MGQIFFNKGLLLDPRKANREGRKLKRQKKIFFDVWVDATIQGCQKYLFPTDVHPILQRKPFPRPFFLFIFFIECGGVKNILCLRIAFFGKKDGKRKGKKGWEKCK